MTRTVPDDQQALELAEKVDPKYRPVWAGLPPAQRAALARYFLPHRSRKAIVGPTRPRVLKWYCPFACQKVFASGHRYCINVYTGCEHRCVYCYAAGYSPTQASTKKNFQRMLTRDMDDLELFDLPPAPVHISNSTDPFQPLEADHGHAGFALEQILAHRTRFTTVTIITKDPLLPVRLGYLPLLKALSDLPADHSRRDEFVSRGLPGLIVKVSLAFWRDEARAAYDPGAPPVAERMAGIRAIAEAGIPLALRIDPLFPRSPISEMPLSTLADFGLPEAQTLDDLASLTSFAREMQVRHVVYSVAKIVQPRYERLSNKMRAMRAAYEDMAAPQKLPFRGGAWRLPPDIANAKILQPFIQLCQRAGLTARYCKQDLIDTP